jgi:hypothetical protein
MPRNNPKGYNQYNRKPGDPRPPVPRPLKKSITSPAEQLNECGCGHKRDQHNPLIGERPCTVHDCDCLAFEGMA